MATRSGRQERSDLHHNSAPAGTFRWRAGGSDHPALTAMLAVQCLIIVSEPFDAMGFENVSEAVQLLFFAVTFIAGRGTGTWMR